MIDGIKRIAEGVIESGKQCSVYTGEITSITPLIIKISDELSLSTQLVVTGRVQTMLNDGDLIVGNSVALLRYQGGQNFLIIDGMDALDTSTSTHASNKNNPHGVTKAQVGLGNANNTTDLAKPVSTAQQTALNLKADKTQVLTNVPANAVFTDTKYSHPAKHPASVITQSSTARFVTDTEKSTWNGKVNQSQVLTNVPANAVFTDTPTDISGKVDKITGMGLSTNDFTTYEKNKLAGLSNYSLPDNVLTTDEQTFNATEKNQIRANVDLTEWQIAKASVNVIAPEQYYGKMAEFSGQTAVGHKGCFRSTSVNNPFLITTFLYIGLQAFYECNFGTFKNAVINAYEIDSMAFNGCTLESVDITNMTNNFGYQMFQDSDIHTIILRPNRVINLTSVNTMKSTPMVAGTGLIYVPDGLLTDYKTATNWTTYASQIKGISEIP